MFESTSMMIKDRLITGLMIVGVAALVVWIAWVEIHRPPDRSERSDRQGVALDSFCDERAFVMILVDKIHEKKPVARLVHRGAKLELHVNEKNNYSLVWTEPYAGDGKEYSCVIVSGIDWTIPPS